MEKEKKLIYSGKLFKLYTWKQKMFDGSYETYEQIVRKPSVQLIVIINDKFVLYKETQPSHGQYISLPGGMVEWDEDFLEGAKRELLEELGLEGDFELFDEHDYGNNITIKTKYYFVRNTKKIQNPRRAVGEKIEPLYLDFEEFVEFTQRKDFRNKYFSYYIKILKLENKLEEFKSKALGLS